MSRPVYAASATLSLSPGSSNVAQGATLTVTIKVNADEPVNGVQANLSYPANLLDFLSIGSSSAFSVVAQNSGGGGSVQIGRGALPPVSGSQTVATVRFKAKTNAGTATINFVGGSQVISASSNKDIMTGSVGGNYTLKPPAAPTPTAPAAPKDTIPPTLSGVNSGNILVTGSTITWTTSEPSTSEVFYGFDQNYGIVQVDPALVTEHKVVLNSALIRPGTTYHFMVKSVDPSGNAASSPDNTFTTKGGALAITVVNKKNKPVSGAKVNFNERKGTTNKKGQVLLKDFPLGKNFGAIEYRGKTTLVNVVVSSIDETKPQAVTFKIDAPVSPIWILLLPLIALGALAVYLARRGKGRGGGGPGLGRFSKRFSGSGSGNNPNVSSTGSSNVTSQPDPPIIRPSVPRGPDL
ncbi:hypothetical protein H0X09_00740 [Candidatus Saccharibacteria bacterium]|nr:hypothetical protein [Candidatus Saccharibacteria bacterium]